MRCNRSADEAVWRWEIFAGCPLIAAVRPVEPCCLSSRPDESCLQDSHVRIALSSCQGRVQFARNADSRVMPDRSESGGFTENITTGRASFQFHIRTILGVTLLAAILARIFRAYRWDGIGLVLDLCATFSLPIEFLWRFWKCFSEPLPASSNTKITHPLDAI